MEWFYHIRPGIAEDRIRELCTLENLPRLCDDVYEVTGPDEISCVWGLFAIHTSQLKHGVRYALTSCPNALQWTVTTRDDVTTIHCAINLADPDPDFAESVRSFMAKFSDALEREK